MLHCSVSSWSRNSFRVAVPGQKSNQCMMHLLLSVLKTTLFIRSMYVKSLSIAPASNTTFWWPLQTWVSYFWASQNTPFGSQGTELWEPIICIWVFFFKGVHNSCKLQRIRKLHKFWLCSPLLLNFSEAYLLKLPFS